MIFTPYIHHPARGFETNSAASTEEACPVIITPKDQEKQIAE
jgi:hypothetical protein